MKCLQGRIKIQSLTSFPDITMATTTADQLPDDVLEVIFDLLTFKDVLSCAGVCQRWRSFAVASPRWNLFQLGLNVGCHRDVSLGDLDFLSTIKEVKLTTSVPIFILGAPDISECQNPKGIALLQRACSVPIKVVRSILTYCSDLRELDISNLLLPGKRSQKSFEELWTSLQPVTNKLKALALPKNFSPSVRCLQSILTNHPQLEKLSVAIGPFRNASDIALWMFQLANHHSIKHLTIHQDYMLPPLQLLDSTTSSAFRGIESLSITHKSQQGKLEYVFALRPFGDAAKHLTHLHVERGTFHEVELVLFYFRSLKTLKVDFIENSELNSMHPLNPVKSATDVSKSLYSVTLGLSPKENTYRGLPRLLNVLEMCKTIKEISLFPAFMVATFAVYPDDEDDQFQQITSSIASKPGLLQKYTSMFLVLQAPGQVEEVGKLLAKMINLKTVYLVIELDIFREPMVNDDYHDVVPAVDSLYIWFSKEHPDNVQHLADVYWFFGQVGQLFITSQMTERHGFGGGNISLTYIVIQE